VTLRCVRLAEELLSVCQQNASLQPIADWKKGWTKVHVDAKPCNPRKYPIMFPDPSFNKGERFIMTPCYHNDVVGLRNRYLKTSQNDFTADKNLINKILDELAEKLRPHFSGPIPLTEFLEVKTGALRKRYEDAAKKTLTTGYSLAKNNRIKAFIKNELYDELKPPRMIMGREVQFNNIYGRFTTPLEHAMIHLPQISKGRNFWERGEQFREQVHGRWILECDFSKYESTQRVEVLTLIELGLWRRLLTPGQYATIVPIFIAKMRKDGATTNNTKFGFDFCRGSGDMDTGLFNTLITWVSCRYFEIVNNTGLGNFVCDGDDNLIGVPMGMASYVNTHAHFGFDAKLILRTDYHDADYCSGKFLQYEPGRFIYVQNVNKMMHNLPVFRKTKFSHCIGEYYYSLGFMYKTMYSNLPLYSQIGDFLMSFTKTRKHVNFNIINEVNPAHAEAFKRTRDVQPVIFDETRTKVEIAMCFNLTTSEIDRLSKWYSATTIELSPDEDKRYNAAKAPAVLLTRTELDIVQSIQEQSAKSEDFSKRYDDILTNVVAHLV
jgi:hypothetical protein